MQDILHRLRARSVCATMSCHSLSCQQIVLTITSMELARAQPELDQATYFRLLEKQFPSRERRQEQIWQLEIERKYLNRISKIEIMQNVNTIRINKKFLHIVYSSTYLRLFQIISTYSHEYFQFSQLQGKRFKSHYKSKGLFD